MGVTLGGVRQIETAYVAAGWHEAEPVRCRGGGVRLNTRDFRIFQDLWGAGVLLTSHVAVLEFEDRLVNRSRSSADEALKAPLRLAQRRLSELYTAGYVRYYPAPRDQRRGRPQHQWALTKRGFQALHAAAPPGFTDRWPKARWRAEDRDRVPGSWSLHSLWVAEIAGWAQKNWGYAWEFESAADSEVDAGTKVVPGNRTIHVRFRPDAILRPPDGGPAWFVEVERAAYEPGWKRKLAAWDLWAKRCDLLSTPAPAVIVIAGFRHDDERRFVRSVLPLLRLVPERLHRYMAFLDLDGFDPNDRRMQVTALVEALHPVVA